VFGAFHSLFAHGFVMPTGRVVGIQYSLFEEDRDEVREAWWSGGGWYEG
jgi:hypothetical protein